MKKITEKYISRRNIIKGAAAGAATFAMPNIIGSAFAQTDTVKILGGSIAALEDWSELEKEAGVKIEFTGVSNDPSVFRQEIAANAAGDRYDIFIMDGGIEDDLGVKGFFMPLDGKDIPSWSSVPAEVLTSPLTTSPDGTQFGLPLVMNADSFGYNVDEIDEQEPLSWNLVFENDKTLGKVALENSWLTTFATAGMFLKETGRQSIGDVSNMNPDEAKAVADYLIERKRAGQFRTFWSTWEESIDLFVRKEVSAANCWEPAVKELQRQGHNIRYARTKEGYSKWVVCAYVAAQVEKRGNIDVVKRALQGFLGGAYSSRIAILRGYATAIPSVGLDYAKNNGLSAEEVSIVEETLKKYNERFSEAKFWLNATPDHMMEIEAEFERFRLA